MLAFHFEMNFQNDATNIIIGPITYSNTNSIHLNAMFMLVNLLAWNMVHNDNDTNENLLEGWSRPIHWDCCNSSFGFMTIVKAWLGEWVKGVSQFSKHTHNCWRWMNPTLPSGFSFWRLEPHNVPDFWDNFWNNKTCPNGAFFRPLERS